MSRCGRSSKLGNSNGAATHFPCALALNWSALVLVSCITFRKEAPNMSERTIARSNLGMSMPHSVQHPDRVNRNRACRIREVLSGLILLEGVLAEYARFAATGQGKAAATAFG